MPEDPLIQVGLSNKHFMEEIYTRFLEDPNSIDISWHHLFRDVEVTPSVSYIQPVIEKALPFSDIRVFHLIQAYRTFGHLMANINPIATHKIEEPWQLELSLHGFHEEELNREFPTYGLLSQERATLRTIVDSLREIYCQNIGIEYMGLQTPLLEEWLQQQIEPSRFKIKLTIDQKKMILQHLNKSELFEIFLHTKYVGQKRFSLEGGETLIPMMAAIVEKGEELGCEEFVIGMAHRGRLNILSNILNKSYADIFHEFEARYIPLSYEGSGDVKYHKGFSSEVRLLNGGKVKIDLVPNPSHLEAVGSVVEGFTRAKQTLKEDENREKVLPILVHGDAAISGQGIVYETMQLYDLEGYSTGGTLHLVINNQIGFTTLPRDGRSTRYCTDIAHTFGAPVFHVNAEDPESCLYAAFLAVELRHRFHCDVFIDLNCYRKYGHNEGDEPAFTQPIEYQIIRKKRSIRELYRDHLIKHDVMEKKMAEELEKDFRNALQKELELIKKVSEEKQKEPEPEEKKEPEALFQEIETGVSFKNLREVAEKISEVPDGFNLHPKLESLVKQRLSMVSKEKETKAVDWGMAELLAYGTLVKEGFDVRLSGQDSCRGTFSHRHAIWVDIKEEERIYYPLKQVAPNQGRFDVFNSPLSEMAVLGFEYGYSLDHPKALVLWEAQFGDFNNGAQVIIDQFMATGEQKWNQKCSVVLLLPHGYEGQGPEHSSARIERFLTLSGNDNLFVVNPTLPAQFFHLLRRQMKMKTRKPLVVFTPKGLLRHSECVNPIEDFIKGTFQEILDDPNPPKKVEKLLLCSGRIYFDLVDERKKRDIKNMAIVRIEQLYPLHLEGIEKLLKKYQGFKECYWVQDEPKNMGAWNFIRPYLRKLLPKGMEVAYIGRKRSASPAVGSLALHKAQYEGMMEDLFHEG